MSTEQSQAPCQGVPSGAPSTPGSCLVRGRGRSQGESLESLGGPAHRNEFLVWPQPTSLWKVTLSQHTLHFHHSNLRLCFSCLNPGPPHLFLSFPRSKLLFTRQGPNPPNISPLCPSDKVNLPFSGLPQTFARIFRAHLPNKYLLGTYDIPISVPGAGCGHGPDKVPPLRQDPVPVYCIWCLVCL